MAHLKSVLFKGILIILLFALISMNLSLIARAASNAENPASNVLPSLIDYYGKSIDVFHMFGQAEISETARNLVDGNGIYHAAGVIVDRNSPSDRLYIYVIDTGNSRILGFNFDCAHSDTCTMDGTQPADIVLGQPNMTKASCNGDNNLGFTQPPTASSLCLLSYPLANNTAEAWMRVNIDVDAAGNLYVPDVFNNRILKYNQPLSSDTTNGKGDSIADAVWGQPNMTSNGRNRGSNYGTVAAPDADSLWINFGPPDHVSSRGVSADANGNVWVADTFNNRILRFGPNATDADLVLGQVDFTSSGCDTSGALDKMCTPTLARVHPTTGDLYVLDEYPAPFLARLLVFSPPFTNGMAATKTFIPQQTGPFTNWDAWDGNGTYQFQSTGFIFNTYKQGAYADGEIWLNEHQSNRTLLIDFDGNIIKVIGAQNQTLRGGDSVYPGCTSIYEGNHLWAPGGSIGLDNANNIYLADEMFHTVYRYSLPYDTHMVDTTECLPDATGVLFPKGPNHQSRDRLGESLGMGVYGNQLFVRDEGMRLKVYNDYQTKPIGASPDYVLTGGFQGRNFLSAATDDAGRLWLSGEHGQIRIYQLPITSDTDTPIADFVPLYWADNPTEEVTRPGGSGYVQVGAMAFDALQQKMYIVDSAGTRILRVSNYNQFQSPDKLLVDMVIGQTNKTGLDCNQGLSSPNAGTLCTATQIKFDTLGNLFVIDNAYECHGNRRIVVFEADDLNNASTLFPNLQASKVFNEPDFTQTINCAYWTVDQPGSPVSMAFNSQNQMVVGNDGYYGELSERHLKQLWFYDDPLNRQTPDASIEIYMGTPGELAFDENDNLLIQDHTWYKVYMINLTSDPEWLQFLPSAPPTLTPGPTRTKTSAWTPTVALTSTATETATYTPTPTVTATSTRTQTLTVTKTPTKTLTPTITRTPTKTSTATITKTSTKTATKTSTKTLTATITKTSTKTVTKTSTKTLTATITKTPTKTATKTFTKTSTATITKTPTKTATRTSTKTLTATITKTPTKTATRTSTRTITRTPTKTATRTATSTPVPSTQTFRSDGGKDGWIREMGEHRGGGNLMDSTDIVFNLGDDAARRQYLAILSFNTVSLPDTAVVTAVTLRVKHDSVIGVGSPASMFAGFWIDIKRGIFGGSDLLETSDFQALANKSYGPFNPALLGGWYTLDISNAANFINKTSVQSGLTQIRLRLTWDDNNDNVMNILKLSSGDAPVASRPQLIVIYHVP